MCGGRYGAPGGSHDVHVAPDPSVIAERAVGVAGRPYLDAVESEIGTPRDVVDQLAAMRIAARPNRHVNQRRVDRLLGTDRLTLLGIRGLKSPAMRVGTPLSNV